MEGLTGVENGLALGVLGVLGVRKAVAVPIHIHCRPAVVAARAQRQDLQERAGRGMAPQTPHTGKPIRLEVESGIEILPIRHAGPPLHNPRGGINRRHGGECRFHLEASLKCGVGGGWKILDRGRLVVGGVGVEVDQGRVLDVLREIRSGLLLGLKGKRPVRDEAGSVRVGGRVVRGGLVLKRARHVAAVVVWRVGALVVWR